MRNYKDVVSARTDDWKPEIRRLMETKTEFVLVHLNPREFYDCQAWAQEFDYDCVVEDKSPWLEAVVNEYPAKLPTALGFVKRGSLKSKSNTNSKLL